ncbi:hypothetical protein [Bartonella refiksaydamii]|uniref:hypothetical protein n=1 Tax=Bartonella refiksaydamii TaxID=2654951 RepID=UPI0012EC9A65|nr:hypothetical protein [Bartonella refiksaydamii]
MFKLFKNRLCLCIFTEFMLCFAQNIEGNTRIMENQIRKELLVIAPNRDTIAKVVDTAVIRNTKEQGWSAFRNVERVSFFKRFWGCVSIISLLSFLAAADILGVVVSIVALLYNIA